MPRTPVTKSSQTPLTTAQRLGSLLKSARDLMRKDKGLQREIDRTFPVLTWIMFLKFLDDMESIREEEATPRARNSSQPSSRRIAGDWAAGKTAPPAMS